MYMLAGCCIFSPGVICGSLFITSSTSAFIFAFCVFIFEGVILPCLSTNNNSFKRSFDLRFNFLIKYVFILFFINYDILFLVHFLWLDMLTVLSQPVYIG